MEPLERLALAVGEEHHEPLAYTTAWFWSAAPGLDWEVSGRGKESWLFLETISHLTAHLFFQSSFLLQSLPSKERTWARGDGPVWTWCDCSHFGEGANGHLRKRRSDSPVLILAGTSFKTPSDGAFLGKTETFLTALAVHMCVVGRAALLQDDHI